MDQKDVSPEQATLENVEGRLAERLGLKGKVREQIKGLIRKGDLLVDELVSEWLEALENLAFERDTREDPLCNLCGESCNFHADVKQPDGLVDQKVVGGFDSTPGNGSGALDDTCVYTFSLCEFCLDWLFTQFKIPPEVRCLSNYGEPEPWKPAAQRVTEDEWRKQKQRFFKEAARRAAARERKLAGEKS
jgi:hypothetical protein